MAFLYLIFSVGYILFSYLVFRIVVKRDYAIRLKLSPASYLLETLVFAIHLNSVYIFLPTPWPGMPLLPESLMLRITSGIIFFVGTAILLLSWFRLGTKPSLGMDKNKLQTGGLYRYSRNPQLIGYGIMLVAILILFFSGLAFIWFLIYIITSYFMIQSEEEYLKNRYQEEYQQYCTDVPRILKLGIN